MNNQLDQILTSSSQPQFSQKLDELYRRQLDASLFEIKSVEWETVLKILREVAEEGDENEREYKTSDEALAGYTKDFDDVDLKPSEFAISPEELKNAHKKVDRDLLDSLRKAIFNVRKYQEEIFVYKNQYEGLRYAPFKRVGICVPGASAPLPSTVIMCAVPAQVADVKEIAVVSPPRYKPHPEAKGTIHPVTLAVCCELGINEVYRVGGAQAVAALACEKGTIPRVDKIVGPGNKWVTTAKKMVANRYTSIDSIAGPSEVLIIVDHNSNPKWVAADMLSQAEHGIDSTAIVVTWSEEIGLKILAELKKQLAELPRKEQAGKSLTECSAIFVVKNESEAINKVNELAPEHLQIQCGKDSLKIAKKIKNAGAIFIGDYSPVAVGDYWAGPSHTLPTTRSARFSSALTSNDFVKSISIIEYDKKKLAESAEDIIRLAEAEGLDAHAKSVQIRQQK